MIRDIENKNKQETKNNDIKDDIEQIVDDYSREVEVSKHNNKYKNKLEMYSDE